MTPHDNLLWIFYGLAAALVATAIPLVQERQRVDGYALAVWAKICVVIVLAPFLLLTGLPTEPKFYAIAAISAAQWAICDVMYFRAIPQVGAGVVSRILPAAVFVSFPVWFAFNPDLLQKYLANPWQFLMIIMILIAASTCSFFLKKCHLSWQGIKILWFVILSAALGPLLTKVGLDAAPAKQAPIAFAVVQGGVMILLWGGYAVLRKPMLLSTFLAPDVFRAGFSVGVVMAVNIYLKMEALRLCDHPALLSVILFTDAVWIVLYYKAIGRKDESNVLAGLGIVACAAALVLVKSL